MDPYAVLGIEPGASEQDVARAYRARAKEWHPDVRGTEDALRRMAIINAAYDQIRNGAVGGGPPATTAARSASGTKTTARRRGHWLPDPVRRALGAELLGALTESERVQLVTQASTWASPQTVLAVCERRLIWLLDDAISHRVRSLEFVAITAIEERRRRRSSSVRVSRRHGKPLEFAELSIPTAGAIVRAVREPAA